MTSGRPPLFVYGTLRHPKVLEAVVGRMPDARPARLSGYGVREIAGTSDPAIHPDPVSVVDGLILDGLTAEEHLRIDYYEGDGEYERRSVRVETGAGAVEAEVFLPTAKQAPPAGPWIFERWSERYGDAMAYAAAEIMAVRDRFSAAEMDRRYPMMLFRAHATARAAREPAPTELRSSFAAADVDVVGTSQPYTEYFAVVERDVRFPLLGGGRSAPVRRAAFVMGDAVTVLPYDPVRDCVLLVEQFRFGPFMRGDPRPWCLEAIAGRIDPGETPEAAARREAEEEARIRMGAMHEVARYYPSTGAVTEWLVSYVGIADLPDSAAVIAGEEAESEDIKGHVIPFERLGQLMATGEVANAPLILTAQWLTLNRDRLRGLA